MPSGASNKDSAAKSAKAIKAIQKSSKSRGIRPKGGMPGKRQIPWITIAAAVSVLALIGAIAWSVYPKYERTVEAERWAPTDSNPDPSQDIPGVVTVEYGGGIHVDPTRRVAYDQSPPFGGPHDGVWADCTGWVYDTAIRSENAVHSLEHGAIWITYNPDEVQGDALDTLRAKVEGESYMMMSPYPGLDSPISLQSWGHQLKVDSADDERIDQFIWALRQNQNTYPEVGASCTGVPGAFDRENPPPFDPTPPGPDAVPMDATTGEGVTVDPAELGLDPSQMPVDPNAVPAPPAEPAPPADPAAPAAPAETAPAAPPAP